MDNTILGLDLGIGSIGWAVINENKNRIEDLGVRIFESGEEGARKSADRSSQKRRSKRAVRRLNRRKKLRKIELKKYLEDQGFITSSEIEMYFQNGGTRGLLYELRCNALDEEISKLDLLGILIHACNYRGYRDFYEQEHRMPTNSDEMDKEESQMMAAFSKFSIMFQQSKYRTVGEMIVRCPEFRTKSGRLKIHNRKNNYEYLLPRNLIMNEIFMILNHQSTYDDSLSPDMIPEIMEIIFRQRDFEDGPGPDPKDEYRISSQKAATSGQQKFTGFNELIGNCPMYPEEKRGTKNSIISDLFILVNVLSQYSYCDTETGSEAGINIEVWEEIVTYLFTNKGKIGVKEFREILKRNKLTMINSKSDERFKYNGKYIAFLQNPEIFQESQIISFMKEDYYCEKSLSVEIGRIMTQYISPIKRIEKLGNLLPEEDLLKAINGGIHLFKSLGTSRLSHKYMSAAIKAFLIGTRYGDFQQQILSEINKNIPRQRLVDAKGKLLPISDLDLIKNPVVYRTINETRKILNAIRSEYPNISQINIEVAREIGLSFEMRRKIELSQNERNAVREEQYRELLNLLTCYGMESSYADKYLNKYVLWKNQSELCIYSGEKINFEVLFTSDVQIDHIVPQSIILDETLNNKVVVFSKENQIKKNMIPLEYLDGDNRKEFINRVYFLFNKGLITKKKKEYLLLENLDSEVVDDYVERNINDTRYIARYLTNYLKKAYPKVKVFAVNGAVTSRFRRHWLGRTNDNPLPSVYGLDEKGRDFHYYHHCVDAVVIANLSRPYIELAQDYLKIKGIRDSITYNSHIGNSATAV